MTLRTVGAGASLVLTGTATTSGAFNIQSGVMRIVAKGASAHVAIGTEPVADNSSFFIHAGEDEQLQMTKASQVIAGITTGTTTVIQAPEGMQMPFNIADRVTLDANDASDANYATKISYVKVIAVDNDIPNPFGDSRKNCNVTVAADTSGIITAYNSKNNSGTLSKQLKLSTVIADGETASSTNSLYFQQVHRTG